MIPFVKDSYLGTLPVNWFPAKDDEKGVIAYGTPGLEQFVALTNVTQIRGLGPINVKLTASDIMYAVARRLNDSVFFSIDYTGTVTEIATFSTSNTGPVWILTNGTQIGIFDGASGYVYDIAGATFAQISDVDFPGASCATYQDGYAIISVPSSKQWNISALYDFTDWDALDFASKEGQPDTLVGLISDHREVWLFGGATAEVDYNAGTSSFPFARLDGGLIEKGLLAKGSLAKLDNSIFWLSDEKLLMKTQQYQPVVAGTEKMNRLISEYTTIDDAIAFGYVDVGHAFYQITFPSAGTNGVTFVVDTATGLVHLRNSFVTGSVNRGRHRANCYCYFGGKHMVGDYENGKIYQMSMDIYDEDGHDIYRELESGELTKGRERIFWPDLQFVFDQGQGLQDGTDPKATLAWSDDQGKTFSTPTSEYVASTGLVGEYTRRTIFRQLGSSFGRIFKMTVNAPTKWVLMSVDKVTA